MAGEGAWKESYFEIVDRYLCYLRYLIQELHAIHKVISNLMTKCTEAFNAR